MTTEMAKDEDMSVLRLPLFPCRYGESDEEDSLRFVSWVTSLIGICWLERAVDWNSLSSPQQEDC